MLPPSLKWLLVVLAQPLLPSGRRAPTDDVLAATRLRYFQPPSVPKLEVFRTGDALEAAAFLEQWSTARDFGLFVHVVTDGSGLSRQRVAILGISRGARVLIYDLRPSFRQQSRPLLPAIADFLRGGTRTFFGMGLQRPVAHLSREFNISIRSIDFRVQAWPQVSFDRGLYRVADRLLGVRFARRPSLTSSHGQAVYTFLQWAVANYCKASFGRPSEEWILTEMQLADINATKLHATRPQHGRREAEEEQRQVEARAEQLMRWRAARALGEKARRGAWKGRRERVATARESRGRGVRHFARALRQRAGQ